MRSKRWPVLRFLFVFVCVDYSTPPLPPFFLFLTSCIHLTRQANRKEKKKIKLRANARSAAAGEDVVEDLEFSD
jgi:hypothetical protein